MSQVRDLPWMRITAEGIAIVVSILLAFSVDAWWNNRQQRSEEKIVLSAVVDELVNVQQSAQTDLKSARLIRASLVKLLRAGTNAQSLSGPEVIDLLEDTTWANTAAHYQVPVLTSLISSGDISLVSDPVLRLDLGKWAGRFNRVALTVSIDRDYLQDRTLPFYSDRAWLLRILNAVDCKPGDPSTCWSYGDKIELSERTDYMVLLADPGFQGMLAGRLLTISDTIDFVLDKLSADLEVLIQAIRADLDK
jgi:hypothetical protein